MKKVLLTGGNGFLGRYIYTELSKNCLITTISRIGSDINADLVSEFPELPSVDLVVHCAGKAHFIPRTEWEKKLFFDVNVIGTSNLLKGLEQTETRPKSLVFISTVAVYGCDTGISINEEYPLEAKDPYGKSKLEAEHLIHKWCLENNVICTILRLPLLVGTNPPGNLGAMIRGIEKGYYFNIGSGKAKKSMVLAEDVAKIIPVVADIGGVYNLTDGYNPTFSELSCIMAKQLGKAMPFNLPIKLAYIVAKFGNLMGNSAPINTLKLSKLTSDLTFDDTKARKLLNWNPISILEGFKIK
jgi:nucleoside-diphosphate-sugar epimerase